MHDSVKKRQFIGHRMESTTTKAWAIQGQHGVAQWRRNPEYQVQLERVEPHSRGQNMMSRRHVGSIYAPYKVTHQSRKKKIIGFGETENLHQSNRSRTSNKAVQGQFPRPWLTQGFKNVCNCGRSSKNKIEKLFQYNIYVVIF